MASVLIVDDDESVRSVVVLMLERGGHSCQVAGNGREALALAEAGSFDVAIVDMILPDVGGLELVCQLKWMSPRLKVAIASGLPDLSLLVAKMPVLEKPFSFGSLLKLVDELT